MSYRKYWLACVICKEKDYHILKEKASQSERERERDKQAEKKILSQYYTAEGK